MLKISYADVLVYLQPSRRNLLLFAQLKIAIKTLKPLRYFENSRLSKAIDVDIHKNNGTYSQFRVRVVKTEER